MTDVLIFLFLLFASVAAWLLDRRVRAAAREKGEAKPTPAAAPLPAGTGAETEARFPSLPPIPLRPPVRIPPVDTPVRHRPAPVRPARVRRARARAVTAARARDGMVLSVILGPCRGIEPRDHRELLS